MLDPALLETLGTIALVLLLFLAAALSILALPWSERDLRKVHDAAVALMLPQRAALAPATARAPRGPAALERHGRRARLA